ncbi:hypothetical protein DAD186_13510 [Dermabacter vaginalis]|uniref:Uncharacterized protein n=1 Tax=Dermabacter vaginalis TaxID=1630135 RepID=A0A1B0ZIZ1_9MICO|nr:hypothetical protein [Dermabacter vaginalis]ANP27901.1 hypothetical protein DAD186_13510 [Dermabacter vaginalis]
MSTAEKNRAHNNALVQKAIVSAVAVGAVIAAVVVLVAWVGFDPLARNGAIVGALLSLVITLPALIVAYWGIAQSPVIMLGTVACTWGGKMLVLIVCLILLREATWLSMPWVGIALLFGAVAPTAVEGVLLARTRPKIEV